MRYGLVIGNAGYRDFPLLRNPRADAAIIDLQLRQLGFQTHCLIDADWRTMTEAFRRFGRTMEMAGEGATAVLYYAGHGVQQRDRNYLLPVNITFDDGDMLERLAVPLDWIVNDVLRNGRRQTRIVVLDACRDNPFPPGQQTRSGVGERRGLAVAAAPKETLLAFSTSPGEVAMDGLGQNSVYAAALAEELMVPAIAVEEMFRRVRAKVERASGGVQTPWEHSSLTQAFSFVPPGTPAPLSRSGTASVQAVQQHGLIKPPVLSEEEIARSGHLIHRLKAKDTSGRWAYYFVYVPQENEAAFLRSIEGDGTIELERYGQVVASCFGETPTREVLEYLRRTYGFSV